MQLMGRHMSLNNLLDLRGAILEYSIKTSDARCGIRAAHRFTLSQRSLDPCRPSHGGTFASPQFVGRSSEFIESSGGRPVEGRHIFAFHRQLSTGATMPL